MLQETEDDAMPPADTSPWDHWFSFVDTVTPSSVDDFKFAGPKDKLAEGWKLIKQGLTMQEPEILGVFLGCSHVCRRSQTC